MTATIDAGRMDQRVKLVRRSTAQDEYGEPIPSDTDVLEVWCEFKQLRGTELLVAQQLNSQAQYQVTMRYRSDVTSKHMLEGVTPAIDGRTFEIVSPPENVDFKDRTLRLMCKEVSVGA